MKQFVIYSLGIVITGVFFYLLKKILNKIPTSFWRKGTTFGFEEQKRGIYSALVLLIIFTVIAFFVIKNIFISFLILPSILIYYYIRRRQYFICKAISLAFILFSWLLTFTNFSLLNIFLLLSENIILVYLYNKITSIEFDDKILDQPWPQAKEHIVEHLSKLTWYVNKPTENMEEGVLSKAKEYWDKNNRIKE